MAYDVTITDVLLAARFLSGKVRRTPFEFSPRLSEMAGASVWFKLENQQIAGSFKPRGAFNRMFAMSEDGAARGL